MGRLNNLSYEIDYPVYGAKFLNDRTLLVAGGDSKSINRLTALTVNPAKKKKPIKKFRELKLSDSNDAPTSLDANNNVILLGCNEGKEFLQQGHNHNLQKFLYHNEHLKYITSTSLEAPVFEDIQFQKLVKLSSDASIAAIASSLVPTVIHILDPINLVVKYEIETNNEVQDLDISPDGKSLIYITNQTLEVISIVTGRSLQRRTDFKNSLLKKIKFINNNNLLLASSPNAGGVKLANISLKNKLKTVNEKIVDKKSKIITSVDVTEKNGVIAIATDEDHLILINIQSLKHLKTYSNLHKLSITSISFSPNGSYLASVSSGQTVIVTEIPDSFGVETHHIYYFFLRSFQAVILGVVIFLAWILYRKQRSKVDLDYFSMCQRTLSPENLQDSVTKTANFVDNIGSKIKNIYNRHEVSSIDQLFDIQSDEFTTEATSTTSITQPSISSSPAASTLTTQSVLESHTTSSISSSKPSTTTSVTTSTTTTTKRSKKLKKKRTKKQKVSSSSSETEVEPEVESTISTISQLQSTSAKTSSASTKLQSRRHRARSKSSSVNPVEFSSESSTDETTTSHTSTTTETSSSSTSSNTSSTKYNKRTLSKANKVQTVHEAEITSEDHIPQPEETETSTTTTVDVLTNDAGLLEELSSETGYEGSSEEGSGYSDEGEYTTEEEIIVSSEEARSATVSEEEKQITVIESATSTEITVTNEQKEEIPTGITEDKAEPKISDIADKGTLAEAEISDSSIEDRIAYEIDHAYDDTTEYEAATDRDLEAGSKGIVDVKSSSVTELESSSEESSPVQATVGSITYAGNFESAKEGVDLQPEEVETSGDEESSDDEFLTAEETLEETHKAHSGEVHGDSDVFETADESFEEDQKSETLSGAQDSGTVSLGDFDDVVAAIQKEFAETVKEELIGNEAGIESGKFKEETVSETIKQTKAEDAVSESDGVSTDSTESLTGKEEKTSESTATDDGDFADDESSDTEELTTDGEDDIESEDDAIESKIKEERTLTETTTVKETFSDSKENIGEGAFEGEITDDAQSISGESSVTESNIEEGSETEDYVSETESLSDAHGQDLKNDGGLKHGEPHSDVQLEDESAEYNGEKDGDFITDEESETDGLESDNEVELTESSASASVTEEDEDTEEDEEYGEDGEYEEEDIESQTDSSDSETEESTYAHDEL